MARKTPEIVKDKLKKCTVIQYIGKYNGQDVWQGGIPDKLGGDILLLVKDNTITKSMGGYEIVRFIRDNFLKK